MHVASLLGDYYYYYYYYYDYNYDYDFDYYYCICHYTATPPPPLLLLYCCYYSQVNASEDLQNIPIYQRPCQERV